MLYQSKAIPFIPFAVEVSLLKVERSMLNLTPRYTSHHRRRQRLDAINHPIFTILQPRTTSRGRTFCG